MQRLGRPLAALLLAAVLGSCGGATLGSTPPSATGPAASPTAPASSPSPAAVAASPGGTALPPPRGTWSRVDVAGVTPAAREDQTWTVDADGRWAYLFGGRGGGTIHDDLWRFDLERGRWERLDPASGGPARRFGHEAAWVAGRGLVIWAGQAGASTFYNDLWLYDPASNRWRELPAAGPKPVPRYGSCSGMGPDGRLWISHGFTEDGVRFADTMAYDFDAARWAVETPAGDGPFERCLHACWWQSDGTFALFGGQTTGTPALGDLWVMTPGGGGPPTNIWRELPEPGPSARQLAAVVRRGAMAVLFGGGGLDRKPLADAWLLADGAAAFAPLRVEGGTPAPRSGATLVDDAARDRLLLFGGLGERAFDDVWSLTLEGAG